MQNPDVKKEYNNLDVIYKIKKQIIKYRIENNDYNPSVKFLDKVANALGKKLEIKFH